ncbi:hypothetical protein [Actinoallomurus iriomotensis]|uniref:Uncharacterized protein n=1 Tax=Actinoallomurus iriomotensis TaxID=478107 RepID=A0A9W6SDC7_9ACTN|nr:hypothetical protein [Actinoallomurus iriomotensis]GLY91513.1 hypothetical protein Airi02_094410 [Actinoallomurus iriomotensis]
MIDEVSWRPEPPAGHRVRSRFLALGTVLLAALAGAAVVWLPGGERRHLSGATAVRSAPVTGPPDSAVTASPAVNAARASVVQVMGTAPSCGRRLAGSGFVYATERVLTPAHVLAGMKAPRPSTTAGADPSRRPW